MDSHSGRKFVRMYAIVDIETTGGNTNSDKITEISIVLHDGRQVEKIFTSLINPEKRIPYRITAITGINDKMVEHAPKFYEIAKQIVELTNDRVFVAHNAKFDYGFLRNEFASLGFEFRLKKLCTLEMSRKLLPGLKSYKLGAICKTLDIEMITAHRAEADARVTAELFERLLAIKKTKGKIADRELSGRLNPDANLHKEQIDLLPEATGLYYFFNKYDQLIYVGKSVNIRSRVLSHFANNANTKALEMKAQIARIRHTVTGSELIALLKESAEIKKFKPVFNRAQRRSRYNTGLYSFIDENGYLNFKAEKVKKGGENVLANFTSQAEGNRFIEHAILEFELCQKLCGQYKVSGPCFHFAIKKCKGACIGEESPEDYNERANHILKKLEFDKKNFIIIDSGRNPSESSIVFVQNGRYCGFGFLENELINNDPALLKECIEKQSDNRNVRQIIQLYIRQGKPQKILEF